jgi:transposase-like protein
MDDGWDSSLLSAAKPPVIAARTNMVVLCCPTCQSVNVHERDNAYSTRLVRWQCLDCGVAWKEERTVAIVHVYAISIPF